MIAKTSVPAAPGRWRYAAGLLRLAAWMIAHPSAPLPDGPLVVLVPPGERGVRLDALKDIADRLGVTEQERDGAIVAERRFGPVRVRAHLVARDHTRQLAVAGVIRKSAPAERGPARAEPHVLEDAYLGAVYGWAGCSFPGGAA